MQDNEKEVHVDPRINVPIQLGPTGAIQQPGGTCILAFKRENKSALCSSSSTFFQLFLNAIREIKT